MGSDASKTSLDDYNKFVTARFNHMKHGGAPDALSHHNGPAEHDPATVFDKSARAVQKVFANDNSMPIGMSAIGVSLLTLAAMLGFRMRRGLQQEADMSIALAPAAAGNILELKRHGSTVGGQVGWSQQSSKNSLPLTLCYATPSGPGGMPHAEDTVIVPQATRYQFLKTVVAGAALAAPTAARASTRDFTDADADMKGLLSSFSFDLDDKAAAAAQKKIDDASRSRKRSRPSSTR